MGCGARSPRVPTATREVARGSLTGSGQRENEKKMSDTILIPYLPLLGACDFVEGEFEGNVYILGDCAQLCLVNN